jgi:hypothetical protein
MSFRLFLGHQGLGLEGCLQLECSEDSEANLEFESIRAKLDLQVFGIFVKNDWGFWWVLVEVEDFSVVIEFGISNQIKAFFSTKTMSGSTIWLLKRNFQRTSYKWCPIKRAATYVHSYCCKLFVWFLAKSLVAVTKKAAYPGESFRKPPHDASYC